MFELVTFQQPVGGKNILSYLELGVNAYKHEAKEVPCADLKF